ncbi:MAG: hypothetical protein KGL39_26505 [Patescibacteria group bacterium]|nr:hypothetical protein [Patescibacteria group bacterium]
MTVNITTHGGTAPLRLAGKQYDSLIAGRVRGALAELGQTQAWLAVRSGLKLVTLKRKLAGQRSFNFGELFVVSAALGVEIVSFIPASRHCDAHDAGSSTPCGACGRARRVCAAWQSKAVQA